MEGYSAVVVMSELWSILRSSPSEFPALHWFYKVTVASLSIEQIVELEGCINNEEVCFVDGLPPLSNHYPFSL
jgi:hypothetical protein